MLGVPPVQLRPTLIAQRVQWLRDPPVHWTRAKWQQVQRTTGAPNDWMAYVAFMNAQ